MHFLLSVKLALTMLDSFACRRIARELVEKWSRPIFDQYREQDPDELSKVRDAEFAKARQRRQQKEAKAAPAQYTGVRFSCIL